MDRYDFKNLKPGDTLIVETEKGSIYSLLTEIQPQLVGGNLFRGFRVTRQSDHRLDGITAGRDASDISDEPACVELHSPETGVMIAGHSMEILPDVLREDADKSHLFGSFVTSGITNIELIPIAHTQN